ncbi:hypothetical protein [Haloarcula laminariae]|uniref:hypothetical protein n=1 Tax=Haloarcula laminariae TaxID=2961577 RepID=UPI00240772C8|nr:hypothetical protein [Halomicroarcula sp. FL173]
MTEHLPTPIENAPPSTKFVYRELCWADVALTYDDLHARTGLAHRTLRRATTTLVDVGAVNREWISGSRVAYEVP